MKTMKYFLALVLPVALLVSCSSPVYVQKDDTANFNSYRTYMWVDTRASEVDQTPRSVAYADVSMKSAVNTELQKNGWREVPDNPDILLSYDVLVERSVEQRSDPVYSQPFTRTYYNPYTKRWATIYYPTQFLGYQTYDVPVKEGTVSVTMMDARLDKIVWQGWTTENLNYSRLTPEEINKSVRNIFSKFDVASR